MTESQLVTAAGMDLEFPMSLGVYDRHVSAQQAVDYLADQGFPVQCRTWRLWAPNSDPSSGPGRLTRGKIAAASALSGLWIGLFVGIAFSLLSDRNQLGFLISTPLLGALFGLAWSRLGYSTATRRGTRDFASVNQVVATKYELLVEHQHAARAHELLATMPREATT